MIFPIEGNRWCVSLGGGRDYPPTDEAGYLEFARSLPGSAIYETIAEAPPLSPVYGYRSTANQLRHFEQMVRWPEAFVALGDAVCAFNPVYGQGMTVAALGAMVLDRCLRRAGSDLVGMARRFQRQLARVNALPWMLATSEDFRYRGTTGPRLGWLTRLIQGYFDQAVRASTQDVLVRKRLLETFHMPRSPMALFVPEMAARILIHPITHRCSVLFRESATSRNEMGNGERSARLGFQAAAGCFPVQEPMSGVRRASPDFTELVSTSRCD